MSIEGAEIYTSTMKLSEGRYLLQIHDVPETLGGTQQHNLNPRHHIYRHRIDSISIILNLNPLSSLLLNS